MSSSNTGPGGVRNLRAMFENKATDQSNSPPSRGRSPNGSVSSAQERPPSKVRANFIAVERGSEEGQLQHTSRKVSDITMDGKSESTAVDDQSLGEILKGSPFIDNGEFPVEPTTEPNPNGVGDRAAAMVKRMQQGNTDPPPVGKFADTDEPPMFKPIGQGRQIRKSYGQTQPHSETNKSPTVPKGPVAKPKGGVAKIQGVMESAARAKEAREAAAKEESSKTGESKPQASVEPVSQAKEKPQSATNDIKSRSTASKPQAVPDFATRAKAARASAVHPAVSNTETIKAPTKPKPPRSSLPTRSLPAAATATTAASAAKAEESKHEDPKPLVKKATKIPPRVANVTVASTLAKKSSRASLNTTDTAKPRTATKPADESFLARMMRPTASSAQKAHDKVQPPSPPRSKPTSEKTLTTRPSRKSLSRPEENKENEPNQAAVPDMPAVPQNHSRAPQQAGITST